MESKIKKPILKWVGGKTQIIDTILAGFPREMNNYREVFLGGGSVLLATLAHIASGNIKIHGAVYAYDINEPLVYVYKNIQSRCVELYEELQNFILEFQSCGAGQVNRSPATIDEAKLTPENYYYWMRARYNAMSAEDKKTPLGSALFIFLNKTCFRGVFRVGPKGFNVPYGHYKNPEIVNLSHLTAVHGIIQGVIFTCCGFDTSLAEVEQDDFTYLDPPYVPMKADSFVGYTAGGFSLAMHNNLFAEVATMTAHGKKIMMSNADVALVREAFIGDNYKITSIMCKRSINSKNPEQKVSEILLTNY